MKLIHALVFFCQGCIFLLVSLVFYPGTTRLLTSLDEQTTWPTPPFWDLSLVLSIVRVIFVVVGVFLVLFGGVILWLKRRSARDTWSREIRWVSRLLRRLKSRD